MANIPLFAESSASIDSWIIFSNANNKYDSIQVDAFYIPLNDIYGKRAIGYSGFFLLPQNTEIHIPPIDGHYIFISRIMGFKKEKSITNEIWFTGCNNFMQVTLDQLFSSFIIYLSPKDDVYAKCEVNPSPTP